ncbi:SDR family oxidoreductase [Candidatus Poribacteria bacterium]|nr:SDR family oxidoreductase [Candidatus Poribacteria bacterium]
MDLGIQGRNAVVCAASRGLGRACATALAREGVNVVICARGADALNDAAEAIRPETKAKVVPIPADVSDPEQARAVIARARAELGQVDILVTNAGGPPPGGLFDTPIESYDTAHRLTLMSVVGLVREVVDEMKARKWGRIVNLSSICVKQPLDRLILSNAVRASVIGFAKTAATELAPFGVTVNNVAPGLIYTDRIVQLLADRATANGTTSEQELAKMEATIPTGRLGKPEELGAFVAFLASEHASYITGATIQVDGGAVRSLL